MRSKLGQQAVGMGFGMIFAIFLIVCFVVFAFIAVNHFFDLGNSASVGLFYDELQEAVDNAGRSQESSREFKINLPSGITHVCFANLSSDITRPGEVYDQIKNYDVYDANVFLIPPEKSQNMQWKLIDRLNISKITEKSNPNCFLVEEGFLVKKGFYDRLVYVEKK